METKEKLKLCPYCEGSVHVDATTCLYCGERLTTEDKKIPLAEQKMPESRSLDDSLATHYQPPYVAKSYERTGVPNPAPKVRAKETAREPSQEHKQREKEAFDESNRTIWSLLLLSIGSHLFTLGWLVFFFSDRGKLALEWKSRYWPLYVLLSLPPIYYGWKSLKTPPRE